MVTPMMKTILSVLLKYTNWIAILFSVFLTLYIIKPFLNGLGCNFELYDYNERINYSLTCKKGVIYNDVWDKETGEKYIKKIALTDIGVGTLIILILVRK